MNVLEQLGGRFFQSNKAKIDSRANSKKENLFAGPNALKQFLAQEANDRSSGYGGHHSGYGGHHSGYGGSHSGYDHHSGYGHDDGYASHSGYGHEPCCPPVIDPLTLAALLGTIVSILK